MHTYVHVIVPFKFVQCIPQLPGYTTTRVKSIKNYVQKFEAEMNSEGICDDVVIGSSSDFGRKLKSNSCGADHGWGGHFFIAGGSVKGG